MKEWKNATVDTYCKNVFMQIYIYIFPFSSILLLPLLSNVYCMPSSVFPKATIQRIFASVYIITSKLRIKYVLFYWYYTTHLIYIPFPSHEYPTFFSQLLQYSFILVVVSGLPDNSSFPKPTQQLYCYQHQQQSKHKTIIPGLSSSG